MSFIRIFYSICFPVFCFFFFWGGAGRPKKSCHFHHVLLQFGITHDFSSTCQWSPWSTDLWLLRRLANGTPNKYIQIYSIQTSHKPGITRIKVRPSHITFFVIVGIHMFVFGAHNKLFSTLNTKFSTTQIDSSLNFWSWRILHPNDGVNWSDRCNTWLLNEVARMETDSKTCQKLRF